MSTPAPTPAPTGESDETEFPTDGDACVFCNHPIQNHEQEQTFQRQEESGEMTAQVRKGRYCWICLKMCWR